MSQNRGRAREGGCRWWPRRCDWVLVLAFVGRDAELREQVAFGHFGALFASGSRVELLRFRHGSKPSLCDVFQCIGFFVSGKRIAVAHVSCLRVVSPGLVALRDSSSCAFAAVMISANRASTVAGAADSLGMISGSFMFAFWFGCDETRAHPLDARP